MRKVCNEVLTELGLENDRLFKLAMELGKIALEDPYFARRTANPNVRLLLGHRPEGRHRHSDEMFHTYLRAARYCRLDDAVEEMITDPEYKIGRPRQLYIGRCQAQCSNRSPNAAKQQTGGRWAALFLPAAFMRRDPQLPKKTTPSRGRL